jgi:hypothetical protein
MERIPSNKLCSSRKCGRSHPLLGCPPARLLGVLARIQI